MDPRIAELLTDVEKRWGHRALVRLGDTPDPEKVEVIPTGFPALDTALGISGLPCGRISEISGADSCGKQALVASLIAQCQREEGVAVYLDPGRRLDPAQMRAYGVDPRALLVAQPEDDCLALEVAIRLARGGDVRLMVFDLGGESRQLSAVSCQQGDGTGGRPGGALAGQDPGGALAGQGVSNALTGQHVGRALTPRRGDQLASRLSQRERALAPPPAARSQSNSARRRGDSTDTSPYGRARRGDELASRGEGATRLPPAEGVIALFGCNSGMRGRRSSALSLALRRLVAAVDGKQIAFVFISSVSATSTKPASQHSAPSTQHSSSGAQALRFFASVRLTMERLEWIRRGRDVMGCRSLVKVAKNKLAPPLKEVELDLLFFRFPPAAPALQLWRSEGAEVASPADLPKPQKKAALGK